MWRAREQRNQGGLCFQEMEEGGEGGKGKEKRGGDHMTFEACHGPLVHDARQA